ncbi:hypothetical protein DPMN_023684 [Dreissena polymorpha]|uniref:Uncharacterized protein n=1 Tax=Dreissena polymorpha TaxID=45954 RepID=A0A9D4LMU8_DREPO|nr:hypothetical protein DPMN_023684 [Dreissena polymorpha]
MIQALGPTLILTWIPNSNLKKNTKSIENSPNRSNRSTPKHSPRRKTPKQEFAKSDNNVATPTTCTTDLSPLDSCVSIGDDKGDKSEEGSIRKKHSIDSVNSEDSLTSKEKGVLNAPSENKGRKLGIENEQFDSGTASIGRNINSDNFSHQDGQAMSENDIHANKVCKINTQLNNLTKLALADEEIDMTKQNHHCRPRTISKQSTSSNKSVSIEIDGDNICVTTEDLEDEVIQDDLNDEKHVIEIVCTQSNSTQNLSTANQNGLNCNKLGEVPTDNHCSRFGGVSPNRTIPPHPQSLNLSGTCDMQYLSAPDISVTRERNPSGSSTTTSGPDSQPPSPYSSSPEQSSGMWEPVINVDTPSSPESLTHNLRFPENSVSKNRSNEKKTAKEQVCGVFSVDLGKSASIKIWGGILETS